MEALSERCEKCGTPLSLSAAAPGCLRCLLWEGFDEAGGRQFQHYEIRLAEDGATFCELGRGAMGTTYRALDTNLGVDVALKVINARYSRQAEARERFRREARAAAQLRHPNVATVFHYGETAEGRCFYAMELVEGETLEALVQRQGSLGVEAVLEIGAQVARALLAAEKHRLIHRDLKPSNLMLMPNEQEPSAAPLVKVIDFGLARGSTRDGTDPGPPRHGLTGTPGFASPEQFATSNSQLDGRSDIYSLGATLWFALCGHPPFEGSDTAELHARQLGEAFTENDPTRTKVLPLFRRLLRSMLAADPARRPQSARALLLALEQSRSALAAARRRPRRFALAALAVIILCAVAFGLTTRNWHRNLPAPEKSIAVLPFDNLSMENTDAFFADGIQDDILTSLAQIQDLKVISRTSVMAYQESHPHNTREIGRALGVENILEGSVRREGKRVLLNLQLIDARSDRHIWAQRYDRTMVDILGLQGELAIEIATALRARLAPEEKARLGRKPTDNPDAYVLYLKAREQARIATSKQEAIAADQTFDQAIALDRAFAPAYARASLLNTKMYRLGQEPARKTKAREQSEEALRLAPELGESHLARGLYLYLVEDNSTEALREFSNASGASPNDSDILELSATIYQHQGRWQEAIATFDRVQELDPSHTHVGGAITRLLLRDWEGAAAAFEHASQIEPNDPNAWVQRACIEFWQKGDVAAARARLDKIPDRAAHTLTAIEAKWSLAMAARDFASATKLAPRMPPEEFPVWNPSGYYQGCLALAQGDTAGASTFFEMVRPIFEAGAREHPDSPTYHRAAGLLYTFMGRKDDALREIGRAIELCPRSKNAVAGAALESTLALAYARGGEADRAVTLLARLLRMPATQISLAELRLSWEWDPLRNNPRFRQILAGPEPETSLTNITPVEPAVSEKSMAVLPFANLSGEKKNAYFASDVKDEVFSDLAKVAEPRVISRTNVMNYPGAAGRTGARSRKLWTLRM